MAAHSAGTRYGSEVGVELTGERSSRLWMTCQAQPVGTASRLLAATVGKLFERSTRKALERALDDIAAAAQRHAERPGSPIRRSERSGT